MEMSESGTKILPIWADSMHYFKTSTYQQCFLYMTNVKSFIIFLYMKVFEKTFFPNALWIYIIHYL